MPFVPQGFEPPEPPETARFRLEPLGPQHNERDYAAWTSSIDHIRSTADFRESSWPHPMSLDENRADLERHARDFAERKGFTYSVLEPETDDVIGCVYLYPSKDGGGVDARSWVRADRAELDGELRTLVAAWLRERWPFEIARPTVSEMTAQLRTRTPTQLSTATVEALDEGRQER